MICQVSDTFFTNILDKVEDAIRFEQEIQEVCEIFKKNEVGFYDLFADAGLVSSVVKCLSQLFSEPEIAADWIDWFIYENDCGNGKKDVVKGGKTFYLNDADALYDFLTTI